MPTITPFMALRPDSTYASRVAALPYDVFTPEEARKEALKNPLSFINIDRPETQFEPGINMYDDKVYKSGARLLWSYKKDGIFIQDIVPCLYIYALTYHGRTQTGIVGCASVSDYKNNVIKRHELTRKAKEDDRYRHIKTCMAQTGPVFLAYRHQDSIDALIKKLTEEQPVYDFVQNNVRQQVWVIDKPEYIQSLCDCLKKVPEAFIADGHHRAAAAVRVSEDLTQADNHIEPGVLSVFFPDNQLEIYPYARTVKDLNGMTPEQFLNALSGDFILKKCDALPKIQTHQTALYLNGWFLLTEKNPYTGEDPVKKLDIAMVQEKIIEKQLDITDIRNDTRIDFIGGVDCAKKLVFRCQNDMAAGFMTKAVTMDELFSVAAKGALMPPKSTWFEPKLLSGLLIHALFADKIAPHIIE